MNQQALKDLAGHLDATLGDYIQSSKIVHDELTLEIRSALDNFLSDTDRLVKQFFEK